MKKTLIIDSEKRRDFLDPDFDFKTSLKLSSNKQRSKCRLNTQGESEIPELGLDAARLKLDCHLNPTQIADAAMRVAKNYNQYRRERQRRKPKHNQHHHQKSGSTIKRKRTKIIIDRDYEKSRHHPSHVSSSSSKKLLVDRVKIREQEDQDDDDD